MTQAMCTSFKQEVLQAQHNFALGSGHTFKIALYTSAAVLNATTTVYATTNEVIGAGYLPGGLALVNAGVTTAGTTAMVSFNNPFWLGATISASQALIYNSTSGNKAVAVLDFGGTQSIVAGTFLIAMPSVTETTAVLRLK